MGLSSTAGDSADYSSTAGDSTDYNNNICVRFDKLPGVLIN